jgi:hypothetical protein
LSWGPATPLAVVPPSYFCTNTAPSLSTCSLCSPVGGACNVSALPWQYLVMTASTIGCAHHSTHDKDEQGSDALGGSLEWLGL